MQHDSMQITRPRCADGLQMDHGARYFAHINTTYFEFTPIRKRFKMNSQLRLSAVSRWNISSDSETDDSALEYEAASFPDVSEVTSLNMKAQCSLETSVTTSNVTQVSHISEQWNPQPHGGETLKKKKSFQKV